jgi:hypothetical protein
MGATATLIQCNTEGPVQVDDGRTVLFNEGFEGGLSKWEGMYMVNAEEIYTKMRVSSDAAHGGKNSLTGDSNMTALYHVESNRVESGVVAVEFYMKATNPAKANFGVQIGQNPGSSGAVSPSFGIYFDPSDSIKCIFFTSWPSNDVQTMVAKIIPDHWYKCRVEVNFENSTALYYVDDQKVHTQTFTSEISLMGIDRVLVYRGKYGKDFSESTDGAKPYYVDDITFYTPK